MRVEETVRDFWATRPRRRAEDRKCAGVAAAIGRRYGVDPVLVRVGFVVTTVYSGVGVLLYLLGWLLLPAEGDEISAAESMLGKGRSSMSMGLTVVLGLALIPAGGAVFGGGGLIVLALCAGALFLLHRHRSSQGEVPVAVPVETATPGVDATPEEAPRITPPAWDPLGAAPFAWDLPEPGPVPPPADPPPHRPRSKVTPITLGLALLVGGIAAAFMPAISLTQVAAAVLGVIGLGLLVGSVLHGGRGLIVAAIPLALATWVLHAAPVTDAGAGERRWSAATPAGLQESYPLTAGSARLDLTDLVLPAGTEARTSVTVSVGEARVFLPPDLDVEVACTAGVGNVACLGQQESGIQPRIETSDEGSDGSGGGLLVLDVRAGTGDVEVVRGG